MFRPTTSSTATVLPASKWSEITLALRRSFAELAGTPKTQERIAHMLKTGKPLRN